MRNWAVVAVLSLAWATAEAETPAKKSGSIPSETTSAKKVAPSPKKPSAAPKSSPSPKVTSSGAAPTPRDNAGEELALSKTGPNASLEPEALADFDVQPAAVQRLLRIGLELTERNLTYTYGSADPARGGMDCSGTIYYILQAAGLKDAPRDSSGLYVWAREAGTLLRVNPTSLDDPALRGMRPGDLLFWEGTYAVKRDPPTSHTMLYLGREKATGKPVMVGASDGRTYRGIRRNGVSVFDFRLPRADSTAKFVAYARVPTLEKPAVTEAVIEKPAAKLPVKAVTKAPAKTSAKKPATGAAGSRKKK